ncbi:MAG: AMP-binding protein [Xanthobacteraceae bacterium]
MTAARQTPPDGRSFFALVGERAAAAAERPFLRTPEGSTISYGEMLARTAQIARVLRAVGAQAGGRVAAKVAKSPEQILLYLACLRAGLVYVPINPDFKTAETAHILHDAEPEVVIGTPGEEDALRALAPAARTLRILSLDASGAGSLMAAAAAECAEFEEPAVRGDDLAVILYTSGTTGRPKGAMLSHGNIAANGLSLSAFWRFTSADVLLHALPAFHSHGLFVSLSCTLLSTSSVILCDRFNLDQTISLMPRVTVFMGVPTMYTRLVTSPRLDRAQCRSVRLFACGSAPLSAGVFNEFEARTGHRIVERYGMSETAINASNPIDGERKQGTVGPPLPGIEIRIAGPEGAPLPVGTVGAVHVRGAHVFRGYWRQPAQTAKVLQADGWFDTGDLGRIDAEGCLTLVGRSSDMIISGGYNVYPLEVESVIDEIPGVGETSIVGLPHGDYGEAVTAVVVRANGQAPDEAEIIRHVKENLAGYKAPKRVLFVESLPRNDVGKVQKTVLRERFRDLYQD